MTTTTTTTNTTNTTAGAEAAAHASHDMVFINLPVADLARSREFFTAVGYEFDERICGENGLGLQLGPNIYAMLLSREFFGTFHKTQTAALGAHEVLTCVSAASREEVDSIVDRAAAAGATEVRTEEQGTFMYGRSYTDLDGHIWEILWMDFAAATEAGVVG